MGDLISRNAALDYHITISDLPGDTKIDVLVGIEVGEKMYRKYIKGLPAAEAQSEAKVEFHDKDHVWIDGKQYISLRRFQEAVKEAQPKEGYWKKDEKDDCPPVFRQFRICSVCGAIETSETNYCPRYGARMKKGEPNG